MKYVFVVEAISTGRYYVREAAERGYTPVVLFPRMAAEAAHYAPFRASVENYLRRYTEHIYYLNDDEKDGTALLEKFHPEAIVAGSEAGVALCDLLARKPGCRATTLRRANAAATNTRWPPQSGARASRRSFRAG